MERYFDDAPADALLGKVTTRYMLGNSDTHVGTIAERIRNALPDVKLIALLRDPIERAVSGYTMAVRREQESKDVDDALMDLLAPEKLKDARLRVAPDNSYVVVGEYGRILEEYRLRFPAEQMLTVFTQDLEDDPGHVLDEVLDFLGLPAGFRPRGLGMRHFRGGTNRRLDPEGERLLVDFLANEMLPHMRGDREANLKTLVMFLMSWNVTPTEPPALSPEIRRHLESHYRHDAEVLATLGIHVPWVAQWDARRQMAGL
jgi:hypothetical protein